MNREIPVLRRAEAQAEAGPLMRMVRRANMGAFHSSRRRKPQRPEAFQGREAFRGQFNLDAAGPDLLKRPGRPRSGRRNPRQQLQD